MKSEADVKKEVKKILSTLQAKWYMPVPGGFGEAGVSDFLVCYRGVYVAIETKYKNNKPTANQLRFGREVEQAGGLFFIINEKNVGELGKRLVFLVDSFLPNSRR